MKYFVVADGHGHATKTINALEEAGFDKLNNNHKVLMLGDMFDRGPENLEMWEFIQELNKEDKLIYILGNHDLFFDDLTDVSFNVLYNGFGKTLKQLFPDVLFEDMEEAFNNSELGKWLLSNPLYFETKNYVFTHAGLPLGSDWKNTINKEHTWTNTEDFFKNDLTVTNDLHKTVVCGHWHAAKLKNTFSDNPSKNITDIYYNEDNHNTYYHSDGQKIGIDGCVNLKFGKINVLVVEDEEE